VTKCSICHQGINSTYIRVGEKSLLNKVGYYCSNCDIHYDLDQKPYTKNEKPYTVNNMEKTPILTPFYKTREPWPGFGPGTSALPRQRSTRLSYQGKPNKIANAKHST
jgi:hypothetical protein